MGEKLNDSFTASYGDESRTTGKEGGLYDQLKVYITHREEEEHNKQTNKEKKGGLGIGMSSRNSTIISTEEERETTGSTSRIDELIAKETDIIRLIKEEGTSLTDYGDGSDIHSIIKDDVLIRDEFDEVLKQFRKDSEPELVLAEDEDDFYDSKEHEEKTNEIMKNLTHGDDLGVESNGSFKEEVIPPENFSHVVGQIYRSSFPRIENFDFLQKRLKLKSILVLIPEEYPSENLEFLQSADIELFQVGMSGNKEPFVNIPSDLLTKALEIVLNPANQPILIHCNSCLLYTSSIL